MKKLFSLKHIKFFKDELNFDPMTIPLENKKEWNNIREKCFDIEVKEALIEANEGTVFSDRGETATQLVDIIMDRIL
jgi:hypothetical protein